jgi:hypothetical protein
MISKRDKNSIIKLIGTRYVSDIKEHLRENRIFNKNGNEHSTSMITNVMNGKPHEVIEEAIYEVAIEKKAAKEARKALLKT